jgi:hypothetical protein
MADFELVNENYLQENATSDIVKIGEHEFNLLDIHILNKGEQAAINRILFMLQNKTKELSVDMEIDITDENMYDLGCMALHDLLETSNKFKLDVIAVLSNLTAGDTLNVISNLEYDHLNELIVAVVNKNKEGLVKKLLAKGSLNRAIINFHQKKL